MKVFFLSSPRAKENLKENIDLIYSSITKLGYENVSDFMQNVDPTRFYANREEEREEHYQAMVKSVKEADVVVFETTTHSLAVGHMVHLSLSLGKPVIALFTVGNTPFFLSGVGSEKLQLIEYTLQNLTQVLQEALAFATEQMDTRFNFFVSPSIVNYLDWVSKQRRIPRAVYLRKLIEQDMQENKEYSGGE